MKLPSYERGLSFLGSKHGLVGGAMSWVSNADLVSALSNAGAFGVLAGGGMPPSLLAEEIKKTQRKTSAPFGVNIITMHPQIEEMVKACLDLKVSHIVFAGGLPTREILGKAKAAGARTMCFAPTLALGKRLIQMGADALVLEGMEAGGHVGPVSTTVLVQSILPHIKDVPVFVAGGIGTGRMMASFLLMGAAGCQLGTRFVCTHESPAHPNLKKAYIRAHARDVLATIQIDPRFPVIPVRVIMNKGIDNFNALQREVAEKVTAGALSLQDGMLKIEHFWDGSLRRAVIDGDVETGSLMAGQSVEFVKEELPVKTVVDSLIAEMNEALSISVHSYQEEEVAP